MVERQATQAALGSFDLPCICYRGLDDDPAPGIIHDVHILYIQFGLQKYRQRRLADRVALQGNLDPSILLTDTATVVRETEAANWGMVSL